VLAASTALGLLHQRVGTRPPVGVDALCPFGGVESLWTLIATGAMIRRIAWSSFLLLAAVIATSLLFRRSFCGNICPLGTLQELSSRLGKRLLGRRRPGQGPVGPLKGDRILRGLKYGTLAVFTVWAAVTASLAIRPYDPWAAYQHLSSPDLFPELTWGFVLLMGTLAGSLLLDRPFCKYLCPMGGLLALLSRASGFKVRRRAETCIDCRACDRSCPVNIQVSTLTTVHDWECINCNECVNACPVENTLVIASRRGRSVPPGIVVWGTAAILTAVILATTATGVFAWRLPDIRTESHEPGGFDPGLITGRNSLREVAAASGVPLRILQSSFGVPEEAVDQPMRDIKELYGFDPDAVRAFVAERLSR
jgi:ferredoxin